jgi:hypothetical protein
MTPMQQTQMFTIGLGEPLRTNVELAAPIDLQAAMHLARAYERHFATSKLGTKQISSTTKSTVSSVAFTSWPHFRRLSLEELVVKRANNECYRCTEKFTPDHRCTAKCVYLIEMDDEVEVDTAANELGISLHTLTGIDIANTMKLHISINEKLLVALVDTGSTHTFIKEGLLSQLSLEVTPQDGLTAKVSNGKWVTSGGICWVAATTLGSEQFQVNFYALPLDGFNVVLGVQSLWTLGPILWDFDNLRMTF